MALNKLISADSHVIEPPDVWTERIDPEFRDRAPRLVWTGSTHTWFIDGDMPAGPGGEVLSEAGKRYDDPDSMSIDSSFEGVRRGAYDPHARLKDLEVDGVVGEVVIPTVPTRFYSLPLDAEFLSACFRAMNDWMADFCRPYPDVLKGLGLINVDDVEDGVGEFDRCLDMGLESVLVTSFPGEDKMYYQPEYRPLWERAQESGRPLVIHTTTQRHGPGSPPTVFARTGFAVQGAASGFDPVDWALRSISAMIFGRVFERYPGVKLALVEFEMGWAPYYLERMDRTYSDLRYTQEAHFKDGKNPSDFWHSNVFVNFTEDRVGMMHRDVIGVDNIMWGSDYPHRESTWPRSQQVLGEILKDIPLEEQTKFVYSNAAKLFRFNK